MPTLLAHAAAFLTLSCVSTKAELDPLIASTTAKGEWITWGGDAGFRAMRRSTRSTPPTSTSSRSPGAGSADASARRPDANYKATPLCRRRALRAHGVNHGMAAIDPATGRDALDVRAAACRTIGGARRLARSRALAYWTDGKQKRIFHNTLDGRLISIDAGDRQGRPELRQRTARSILQGRPRPTTARADRRLVFTRRIVVGDVIVVQVIGDDHAAEQGGDARLHPRLRRPHRQAASGPSTPSRRPGEFGNETWEKDSWKYTGNTGVWSMMSADPELGYVYLPVESAHQRLLRRPAAGRQPVRRKHRLPRRQDRQARLALPDRAPRRLGLRPAGRADPARHRQGRQDASRRSPSSPSRA